VHDAAAVNPQRLLKLYLEAALLIVSFHLQRSDMLIYEADRHAKKAN